jgi:nucleoside phosphorylase
MASSQNSHFTNDEYTVGWICTLSIELAAAKGMLDDIHGPPQTPPDKADNNTYVLGSMGKFKVVIACLPIHQLGSFSAAAVAKDMLFTFPQIRVGLLVGVGAGIPDFQDGKEQDIRLGDVVIGSHPQNGGVVVYDFGKKLADGSFESLSALNRPPRSLGAALGRLRAEHEMNENKISQYIEEMLKKFPKIRTGYSHPGESSDRLFQFSYPHAVGGTCAQCDLSEVVFRQSRPDSTPVIHYGTIASGNTVVKNAFLREKIREKHGAICLEMEAAGLMNNFPCVVIRGISNYADSHKNDHWQRFAAAAAAACAKEFLEHVQLKAVDGEPILKDIVLQG